MARHCNLGNWNYFRDPRGAALKEGAVHLADVLAALKRSAVPVVSVDIPSVSMFNRKQIS
jgi:hypothetical protein